MRKIAYLIVILFLILLGILFLLEKSNTTNFIKTKPASTVQSGPTEEEKKIESEANANSKKQLLENESKASDNNTPSTPTRSIEITAVQESNNTVTVLTQLPGFSDGRCMLTTTNGSLSNQQEAEVIYQREASSCAGFSIPITELGKGEWIIKLDVTTNSTTESKSISFKVI